jgi:hypothetical protein
VPKIKNIIKTKRKVYGIDVFAGGVKKIDSYKRFDFS